MKVVGLVKLVISTTGRNLLFLMQTYKADFSRWSK